MATHTMPLREYIEMWTQHEEGLTRNERIEIGRTKLFDFHYPIFDEDYKKVFETNFIRHFYMKEIGFETEELFKLRLEDWLNINMGYFNKLFESELIEFDPLSNSKVDVTHTKKNDSNATTDSTSSGNSVVTVDNFERDLNSKTPDGRLEITTNDGEGVITYANEINEQTENNKSNSSSNVNDASNMVASTLEDYAQQRSGKIGVQSYSKMLQEFRDSFLRIEKQIFKEMTELFMMIYS